MELIEEEGGLKVASVEALQSEVVDRVAALTGSVRERVVDHLAQHEINSRVDLMLAVLKKHKELRGELKRLKPDVKYNVSGQKEESYSPDVFKKREQLFARIAKIDAALALAIDKGQYDKLREVSGDGKAADNSHSTP